MVFGCCPMKINYWGAKFTGNKFVRLTSSDIVGMSPAKQSAVKSWTIWVQHKRDPWRTSCVFPVLDQWPADPGDRFLNFCFGQSKTSSSQSQSDTWFAWLVTWVAVTSPTTPRLHACAGAWCVRPRADRRDLESSGDLRLSCDRSTTPSWKRLVGRVYIACTRLCTLHRSFLERARRACIARVCVVSCVCKST